MRYKKISKIDHIKNKIKTLLLSLKLTGVKSNKKKSEDEKFEDGELLIQIGMDGFLIRPASLWLWGSQGPPCKVKQPGFDHFVEGQEIRPFPYLILGTGCSTMQG